jgi:competence transcription factor ComK
MANTQYAVVANAPKGIGTMTPILIDPATVTWTPPTAVPPSWAPCWIVWNISHNKFSGIGWHAIMPQYVVPASVELGGLNSAFPPQPTLL